MSGLCIIRNLKVLQGAALISIFGLCVKSLKWKTTKHAEE